MRTVRRMFFSSSTMKTVEGMARIVYASRRGSGSGAGRRARSGGSAGGAGRRQLHAAQLLPGIPEAPPGRARPQPQARPQGAGIDLQVAQGALHGGQLALVVVVAAHQVVSGDPLAGAGVDGG